MGGSGSVASGRPAGGGRHGLVGRQWPGTPVGQEGQPGGQGPAAEKEEGTVPGEDRGWRSGGAGGGAAVGATAAHWQAAEAGAGGAGTEEEGGGVWISGRGKDGGASSPTHQMCA
jgi:hypothetical protein